MGKFQKLLESFDVYCFYSTDKVIVCHKFKDGTKHFISHHGCDCKGYKIKGVCKHWNMLKGIWTPADGTPEWFDAMLSDIIEPTDLPEFFNTAVVRMELPDGFQMACFTIRHEGFSMGVQVIDPFKFEPAKFFGVMYGDSQ